MQPQCLTLLLTLSSLAIAGCAGTIYSPPSPSPTLQSIEEQKQLSLIVATRFGQQARINNIALPLLIAAKEFCSDNTRAVLGFSVGNKWSIEEAYRDTLVRDFKLGEPLQVMQVIPASAAEHAGVKRGDIVISLNEQQFDTGQQAQKSFINATTSLSLDKPVTLTVARVDKKAARHSDPATDIARHNFERQVFEIPIVEHQIFEFELTPQTACNFPIKFRQDDQVNAFADGEQIFITQGLLRFTANDEELALIIAHEIAHNALNHVPKTLTNALAGSVADIIFLTYGIPSPALFTLSGAQRQSRNFEQEADYIALYLLARAGLRFDNAAQFWRRIAAEYPQQLDQKRNSTHPSPPLRFIIMADAIKEIKDKQKRGLPLNPEYLVEPTHNQPRDNFQEEKLGQNPQLTTKPN